VRRIAAHLRADYSQATVTLPTDEEYTVGEMSDEKLYQLVRVGIERARGYGMTFESSLAAFTAVMFEIAPNFDEHRLSQVLLHDEQVAPDARLDELLEVLTEKNWEAIRADYDPQAWNQPEKSTESTTEEETPKQFEEPKNLDLEATIRNF